MKNMNNLVAKIKSPIKRAYHYLSEYDFDRMSIDGQIAGKILAYLSYAILHHVFVMITYYDGHTDIGQISRRLSAGRFVFLCSDNKILKIVDLDDIFRVDLT
ncbi:hypothetical protein FD39_GL000957 [Lactobacillus amylolyticus DSM 11664]|nr:hypothetical protein FD39_GL000957 [Lactobacillus amylolyticus DSM 11664]